MFGFSVMLSNFFMFFVVYVKLCIVFCLNEVIMNFMVVFASYRFNVVGDEFINVKMIIFVMFVVFVGMLMNLKKFICL